MTFPTEHKTYMKAITNTKEKMMASVRVVHSAMRGQRTEQNNYKLKVKLVGFDFQPHWFLAMSSWMRHLTFLCLRFLVCKMGKC